LDIREILKSRVMVLDGAMGSLIQVHQLREEDYRGKGFRSHPRPLAGNYDLLSLTRPDIIARVHEDYLEAGADIIETNTLNANRISQSGYQLEEYTHRLNRQSARLARKAARRFSTPQRPRFVAGSIGSTSKTGSLSPDINRPAYREVDFATLKDSYRQQVDGLLDGGVDLLLIETVYDLVNCRAAVAAARESLQEHGLHLPLMVSITVSPSSGRVLSGQTLEAFYNVFHGQDLLSFGLNCSSGSQGLVPWVRELHKFSSFYLSLYPNAGVPDEEGRYKETPRAMRSYLQPLLDEGCLNIIGGCCGTTPDHIRQLDRAVKTARPRVPVSGDRTVRLSGLDPLNVRPDSNLVNISERTNVAGSRRFARTIKSRKYDRALEIARKQIEKGAQVLDINLDDPLIDSVGQLQHLLKLIHSEPEIARVPVMIDSSDWKVIAAGLQYLPGKGIVNSISLKQGEGDFLEKAEYIKNHGAAAVVMAFDEKGQAVDYRHKIDICRRSYQLLTERLGYLPQDIILDPNVLTIGTGIREHAHYARDYLQAVEWISQNLPGCSISGGISNLSFAFRGNDQLREAIHSVFLYHAVRRGLTMAIVNAGKLPLYEDIHPRLRKVITDLIFNRDPQATAKLLQEARNGLAGGGSPRSEEQEEWRNSPPEERLRYALIRGNTQHLEPDLDQMMKKYPDPVRIIEGPVMDAVLEVGQLFGSGRMFLPQVVKTARVMKMMVDYLRPHFRSGGGESPKAGKILLATVLGDVHDIGKNIVGIILKCNNFRIFDLGVGVPPGRIIRSAREKGVDVIGLSGLISPSLNEMADVLKEMKKQHLTLPVLIGGAATSKPHTALKLAPLSAGPVIHAADASEGARFSGLLMNPQKKKTFLKKIGEEYRELRRTMTSRANPPDLVPLPAADSRKPRLSFPPNIQPPGFTGNRCLGPTPLSKIRGYVNWTSFLGTWGFKGTYPALLETEHQGISARQLFDEANEVLDRLSTDRILEPRAVVGFYPAQSDEENSILVYGADRPSTLRLTLPCLRQQQPTAGKSLLCLSDFIAPRKSGIMDYIGFYTVSCNDGREHYLEKAAEAGDSYQRLLVQKVINALTEAYSEWLHREVRRDLWGYAAGEDLPVEALFRNQYRGIRPAPGYPSLPDHTLKADFFSLLQVSEHLHLSLTRNHMITPPAATTGIYLAHPRARYFSIHRISGQQFRRYWKKRKREEGELRRALVRVLS